MPPWATAKGAPANSSDAAAEGQMAVRPPGDVQPVGVEGRRVAVGEPSSSVADRCVDDGRPRSHRRRRCAWWPGWGCGGAGTRRRLHRSVWAARSRAPPAGPLQQQCSGRDEVDRRLMPGKEQHDAQGDHFLLAQALLAAGRL